MALFRSRFLVLGLVTAAAMLGLPLAPAGAKAVSLVLEQQLLPGQTDPFEYGRQLGLDGDRLVIAGRPQAGGYAVRYYRRTGTSWSLRRTIALGNEYPYNISLDGGTVAVGLPYTHAGEVRLYALDQPAAAPVVVPTPLPVPVDGSGTGFGYGVCLDGSRMLVALDGGMR